MKNIDIKEFVLRLSKISSTLWTNTELRPDQYAHPVLTLIAIRQMEVRFNASKVKTPADCHRAGVIFLPEDARFSNILKLPDTESLAEELNYAIEQLIKYNPDLDGILANYEALPDSVLRSMMQELNGLKVTGDAYGLIFEYYMDTFASSYMQKGGEYFTPQSLVKLIVGVLEPYQGKVFDPACGSGGMFVQCADFVKQHAKHLNNVSIYGIEKMADTQKICRLNLAVRGLRGDIRVASSYYEDPHSMVGKFDFVMANPPFNQKDVDHDRLRDKTGKLAKRFSLGVPTVDNANYLWIGMIASALNANGRAGFVMPNSTSDAGGSEREMRRKLIESGVVDAIVSMSSHMFFTTTIPVTLWFLDKRKVGTPDANEILFIDASKIFRQTARTRRDLAPDQIELLCNIIRLYRGEEECLENNSGQEMLRLFGETGGYQDIPGLCKVASREDIIRQNWSLNPGRYVGFAPRKILKYEDFCKRLEALQEELEGLNAKAARLQDVIAANVAEVLA